MYHTVYKITNLWDDKFYIGMHSTDNLEDGYLGSGKEIKKAFKEYGRMFLDKEILYFCKDRKTAASIEHSLITEALKAEPDRCYNLTTRYGGGNYGRPGKFGKENPFYGRTHSEETVSKISFSLKERGFSGKRNPFYGKKHKPEAIESAKRKREAKGTYYIDRNPNRLKSVYAQGGRWWCTPEGCFTSVRAAEKYLGVTSSCIRDRCKWGDEGKAVTSSRSLGKDSVGKTWKELGYYSLPRKAYKMNTRKRTYSPNSPENK